MNVYRHTPTKILRKQYDRELRRKAAALDHDPERAMLHHEVAMDIADALDERTNQPITEARRPPRSPGGVTPSDQWDIKR